MTDWILYALKTTCCFVALYLVYVSVIKRDKNLLLNRVYLLVVLVFSSLVPLLSISLPGSSSSISEMASLVQSSSLSNNNANNISNSIVTTTSKSVVFDKIIIGILFISGVMMFRLLINLSRITYRIFSSPKRVIDGAVLVYTNDTTEVHSFFKFIFLSPKYRTVREEVLTHERAHGRQYHTFDVLVAQLALTIFWWNPFVWLIKKEIQLNHEFLADDVVLQKFSVSNYQRILVGEIEQQSNSMAFASHFSYYSTKRRFIMMTVKKTEKKMQFIKGLIVVPMMLLLATFSINLNAQDEIKSKEKKSLKIEIADENLSEDQIQDLIDEQFKKFDLSRENSNVNINTNNGVTTIEIIDNLADFESITSADKIIEKVKIALDEIDLEQLDQAIESAVSNNIEMNLEIKMDMDTELDKLMEDLEKHMTNVQIDIDKRIDVEMKGLEYELEDIEEKVEEDENRENHKAVHSSKVIIIKTDKDSNKKVKRNNKKENNKQ